MHQRSKDRFKALQKCSLFALLFLIYANYLKLVSSFLMPIYISRKNNFTKNYRKSDQRSRSLEK